MSSKENFEELFEALKIFCTTEKFKPYFSKYLETADFTITDTQDVINILSSLLLNSEFTLDVVKCFSKYLLQLLYLAIPLDSSKIGSYDIHVRNCVALSLISKNHPDANRFMLQYFENYPSPFDKDHFDDKKHGVPVKRFKTNVPKIEINDLQLVECCYDLLQTNADFFRSKWDWSLFMQKYYNHNEVMVKWLCYRCIGIITGMNELQLNSLNEKLLPKDKVIECTIKHHNNMKNRHLNLNIIKDYRKTSTESSDGSKPIILDNVISVAGILLPIYKKSSIVTHLVPVKSAQSNLQKVALGIAANRAICLQGPVGSSKTALVEYLASLTGRKLGESFIKVQLGDQTDSKMLLGTYRCTDIPGEFVWQPGVLTQAVTEGSWLLLEDIDSASMDIATVVTSLLENGYLSVPGFRDTVPVTPGFQLFVTQRLIASVTGYHKKHSNVNTILEKHLLQINIEPLTQVELVEIIKFTYPSLTTIATRIVDVFMLFSLGQHGNETINIPKSGRLTSTRDLFKWCERAIIDFDVSSQNSALKVFQDSIDIFCCSLPSTEERLKLAKEICIKLGIIETKAEYFCNSYKPNLSLTASSLTAGRTIISRQMDVLYSKKSKFSFTRPSACLLERIIGCVNLKEPVLLVGETGTGKTSSVQYLAQTTGQKLIVINMNQQSDSADLLGGYKPVDLKYVIAPIKLEFELLFREFFSVDQNQKFLQHIATCFNGAKWSTLLTLMKHSQSAAIKRLQEGGQKLGEKRSGTSPNKIDSENFSKRWTQVGIKLNKLSVQLKQQNALAFAFIEGSLVKAIEKGYWVLLDEINLANAETLECLSGLLEGSKGSLSLLERGDRKPIVRHEKFTLFACMNPSTDVGKKDLPAGLRNRFTEFFVEELTEKNDLILLVNSYLKDISVPQPKIESIVKFYLNIRREAIINLSDGLGHKPHYSLRTLCRALVIASKNACGSVERNLYEAFCLSFLTQLDTNSYKIVEQMIAKAVIGGSKEAKSVLKQPIVKPKSDKENKFVQFEGYWVSQGNLEPEIPKEYVLTESVRRNLKDLVRVVAIGRLPVLLQGDTSVGKTSLISYLAKASGNKCMRINNHEHTDLQEYVGSYVADVDGKLVFREGVLVEAMRKGHWIILDELNLAPTDVLEALNRVLDDNRELFIPETQETIKAHSKFMLFATQNPPGAYGGRKMLSRAFRNRFVELHFNEIPPNELETILHQRCEIPLSYCKKMIAVMTDLQLRRKSSAAFAGKQGFITLRDLFRWGERYRLAPNVDGLYDWDQHIADEGYLVLAGRVRKIEERNEIMEVLKKHIKRSVTPENLFSLHDKTSPVTKQILQKIYNNKHLYKNIVWTFNTRQLAVLVGKALQFTEPVLLIGETGGGKTTICKLIAENNGQKLITVNCHMHTESSDFIGGLRPVREHNDNDKNKLFEWVDGPLLQAMQTGDVFLADEISLADDSVLERLNSLLEPERSLLLAEKGTDLSSSSETVILTANKDFHFIGTMNPGGDFGKKELSPALRNRFTEIWCEACTDRSDLVEIIEHNLTSGLCFGNQEDGSSGIGRSIMDFVEWFRKTEIGKRFTISIRDILTWVNFINVCSESIDISDAYLHGAYLTFLDSFGSGVTGMESTAALKKLRDECTEFLLNQINSNGLSSTSFDFKNVKVEFNDEQFGIRPFYIKKGDFKSTKDNFTFTAPTVLFNSLRLLRGLQLNKALLLEGSPGVGKTSLVSALAKITDHKLLRINLSDQTDICDLFGADLPVEGGQGGEFAWRDGPFLQALKNGDWIVLDELNLASQSVLEGLNACLDHRGEIFIPELGKTFFVKPGTRLFACQNPLRQGGSRRGLPKSFLNRFTQVYVDSLTETDLLLILNSQFPDIPLSIREKMIEFNKQIVEETNTYKFGHKGSPWEFNLRDITRWCQVMIYSSKISQEKELNPASSVNLIYGDRMRTEFDKIRVREIFESVFDVSISGDCPLPYVTEKFVFMGDVKMRRGSEDYDVNLSVLRQEKNCLLLRNQFHVLRSLMYCANLNWMAILVGSSASGKSSVVKTLSQLSGCELRTLSVNSAMDTTDILGGFEQADYNRHLEEISNKIERILLSVIQQCLLHTIDVEISAKLLRKWEVYRNIRHEETENVTMADETKLFEAKLLKLKDILLFLKGHKFAKLSLEQLNNLQMRLDKLKKNVEIEGTLNAGGKFEWVDSILIKCLQDGCWLLIENVNLCSPAVLDRLNALLEPNGVLTIGERGVDKNGEMIQIIPHPNFRLFLTMDPKNGEISRAMRNRGVEIYMLNEIESKDRNEFDTKAVIEQNGLNIEGLQEILLNLHDFISQTVLGEKPTVSNILQASFLISQQLLRGINIIDAFTSSLIDVYIKTRSINDFAINDPLNTIECYIKSTVQDYLKRSNELSSNYYNRTLKTMDLQNNSKFEIIKQQNILIQQYSQQWNYSIYFYLLSYFITSNNNLNIRYSHLLNESNQFNKDSNMLNEKLYSTMNDFFKKYISRDNKDMPLDYLSLKDTKEKYTNLCESNQMFLLSYFVILKTLNDSQLAEEIGKKFTKLTILQYSKAVFDKKLSKSTIDHPLIINLYKLIVNFDDYLIFILSTQNLKLTSEDTIFATLALNWRFVLQEIGNLIVYDKNNKKLNLNTILSQLIIRYKWFIKHTVRYFTKLSNPEQARRLEDVIELISTSVQNDFSNFSKISNRFVKNSPRPLPLTSEEQIDIMTSLENILNETSIMRKNNYNVQTKCYLIINIPEFSEKLIETRKEVRNNILNKENIEQLREYSSRCINKELKLTEIQLLPVKDFFALQIISHVQNIIFSSENITDEKCNILRKLTTVSPELNETLETYFATRNENLIPELTLLKTIYLKCAVSLVPSSYLSWNTENKNLKTLSTHVPILTYSVTNLCVSPTGSNDLVSVTNLERYKERSEQLSFLNELLWKNIPALSSDEFNFSKNDSVYIVHSFGRFIIFLEKCLTGQNSNAATTDIIQKCINKITEIYSSNIESEEMLRNKNKIMHIFDQLCLRIDKLKTAEDIDCLIHTANAYCLLNYLKALLNSQLQVIDPLEKKALKKQYCEEKRKICTNLKDAFVAQNEIFSGQIKTLHPFCAILSQKISECEDKETELGKLVAVRPSNITYQSLLKDVSHNLATLLSDDFFMKMYEKLNACILNLQEAINSNKDINLEQSRDVLNQSSSWMYSQENSYIKLLKYRVGYPDIIENLLSNITELSYGIKLLHTTLQKLIKRYENMNQDLNKFMENLVQFPVLSEIQRNIYSFIEMCTEYKNINFVSKTISNEEIPNLVKQENLRMLKCGIQEMFNLIVTIAPIYLEPQSKMLLYLENLISLFVSAWCKQESEKQRREEEEQSLYKTKSVCENLTEEEETERDMKLLFPNYHELDFSDFQEKQLTDTPEKITEESEIIGVISSEDVKFVSGIHSQLMQLFTKSEWLNPNTKKKNLEPNFVTPLLERYKVFSLLQEKLIEGLDNKIDENLISSLNLLVSITKHHGESDDELAKIHSSPRKSKEKSYDFYKDSKVEEIKSCLPVLEALKNRITELLINWPSHPTLQSIASIIDRIYSFSVISPISRFLTGFEILLSKCNEWEENAHTGVSLQEYSQNITLQIISWRKLELSGWRDGLNNAVERIKSSVSKWWFHIYSSINEFIENKESSSSTNKLIKLFQEFIEKSPLGEYENRLDLLFTFHCHSLHLPKSKNKNIVLSILWNLFHYYAQFIPNIDTKIKNLRLPIEKKLKDFVKIARWNDINYWSVKETVEKTHRTLHKYIKEFENSLKQGVSDCLVNINSDASSSEQVGIWDRPTRHTPSQYHYSLDASNYMASTKYKKLITDNNSSELEEISDSLLNKSEKYFSKSRSFCKDVISNTSYPHLIQNLDTFVTEIIETSNHLRSLEINKELDIKKRKSQAKSILQQKRKALADLFKTLTKCGLSYRTGIIEAKLRENSSKEFLLRPLDLNASLAHLKSKGACDKQLLNIWDGCETYFMRTIARLAGLESALKQPAQDLGLPNIERCKGFSFHLMILAQEQKSKLINTTRNLYHLRNCVNLISEWDDESEMIKTETVKSISNLLSNIIIVMEQYKIILLSCPEQPNFEADLMDIPVVNTDNQITIKYANDTNWNKCLSEIKIIITSSHKLKTTIDKLQNIYPASENQIEKSDYLFISDKDNLFSELRNLACKIESLQIIFGNNSISKSVNWLIKEIQANLELFLLEYIDDNESQVEVIKFKSDIEKLLEKTLVIIQNLYKKYQKKLETKEGSADETTINEEKLDTFEDNHLKNLVVENLFEDLSALEIKNIHKKVKKSIEKIFKMNLKDAKDCKLLLSQCIPLLEQIILLYQYFVIQQVSAYRVTCKLSSVLLNIFIELASKGFCVPQELSDEIDSEGQSNQVGGGMGLGEGEGEKDVSDRIESEDQLDDAQPAGQEKKNEDKNCREEDKGIEMSEDFEGQLQDVDKPEDDESKSDSDSDAEKQMGDTEKDSNQLDQKIWGSDDEIDDETDEKEQEKQDKEEKGEGGELEDLQMAAKEDGSKSIEDKDEQQLDNNDTKKEQQKDINEMDEPEYDEDQVDPYHGKQPPPPEPESMDLPDDLQLDDGEEKEEQDNGDENPFDIDKMKEQMPSEEQRDDGEKEEKIPETENTEQNDTDSNDEDELSTAENMESDKPEEKSETSEDKNDQKDSNGMQEKQEQDKKENEETETEDASAPDNQQSKEEEIQPMEIDNVEACDNVQTNPNQTQSQQTDAICQENNEEKDGVGQSQMEESDTGHHGELNAPKDNSSSHHEKEILQEKRQKPGESDTNRSLGETAEPVKKKLKTIDIKNKDSDDEDIDEESEQDKNADMYQHIKEAKVSDTQVMDVATKEQAETQKIQSLEEEDKEDVKEQPTEMQTDEPEPEIVDIPEQKTEKTESKSQKKADGKQKQGDIIEEMKDIEIEGERVDTMSVPRGNETTYHTQYDLLGETQIERLSSFQIQDLRCEIENQLGTWNEPPPNMEAEQTWEKFSAITTSLARDLSEQLRLVLEPTQASRLRGDFRTGRRINMRKVIPYIASQFRKDKIWLRRTKPSKREYQIVLAIDDSSSMADNHSKELAFESVALISKALSLLESGQLSVVSFGETTEILHKLTDTFTEKSGVKLLQKFQFQQKKTCVAKLVDFVTTMFSDTHTTVPNAKLLIVVSDGRGIFSEGETYVQQAIRRAKFSDIFMVFVIVDNPENKNSVLDIRMPIFKDGKLLGIKSYLDNFPFPFYIILQDINSLPSVLSDALRQWFELITNVDK